MAGFRAVAFPEVDAVLARLTADFRVVLVTNSPRAHAALDDMGLADHFETVVELPPSCASPDRRGSGTRPSNSASSPPTWSTSGTATAATSRPASPPACARSGSTAGARSLPVPDGVTRITSLEALPAVLA